MMAQEQGLFLLENIYRQYLACRKIKRKTASSLRFEARQELNLLALRDALVDRSYAAGVNATGVTMQLVQLVQLGAAGVRPLVSRAHSRARSRQRAPKHLGEAPASSSAVGKSLQILGFAPAAPALRLTSISAWPATLSCGSGEAR